MTPIKVFIVPRVEIDVLCGSPPIPQGSLNAYLALRPGILSDGNCDIFQENSRSIKQRWTDFSVFDIRQSVDAETAIVFPCWLELFENDCREKISHCLSWLNSAYPNNIKVVQWNHDRDAATVPEFRCLDESFLILNFNTSRLSANDLLLPFWSVESKIDWEPPGTKRMLRGSFIGTVVGETRRSMMRAFEGRPDWEVHDAKVPHDEYIGVLACSEFALCPRGGGLNSYRLYEAIQCGAIPVLFADDAVLPYPGLAWSDFIIRIPERYAGNFSYVNDLLDQADVSKMRENLAAVRERMSLAGVQREIWRRLQWMTGEFELT